MFIVLYFLEVYSMKKYIVLVYAYYMPDGQSTNAVQVNHEEGTGRATQGRNAVSACYNAHVRTLPLSLKWCQNYHLGPTTRGR